MCVYIHTYMMLTVYINKCLSRMRKEFLNEMRSCIILNLSIHLSSVQKFEEQNLFFMLNIELIRSMLICEL
jgi:hypothetical protein